MKMGVREICEVVLRAKGKQTLGSRTFYKNEPVLYFDSLKTSSLEGNATTVYATGGRGNSQLLAWEGERTMTFTMEDALISPEGFMILSGADLVEATAAAPINVHHTSRVKVETAGTIVLKGVTNVVTGEVYVMALDDAGEIISEPCVPASVSETAGDTTIKCDAHEHAKVGTYVLVDYYVKMESNVSQIEITPDKFGGYYYLEASTLFRRESDGKDLPAEFVIPRCKVQSNFTFSMAATGDPSTFTFTMDAFPDYTKFDQTKKVLCAIQIVDEDADAEDDGTRAPCDGNVQDT